MRQQPAYYNVTRVDVQCAIAIAMAIAMEIDDETMVGNQGVGGQLRMAIAAWQRPDTSLEQPLDFLYRTLASVPNDSPDIPTTCPRPTGIRRRQPRRVTIEGTKDAPRPGTIDSAMPGWWLFLFTPEPRRGSAARTLLARDCALSHVDGACS